jgi:hypothetical protein
MKIRIKVQPTGLLNGAEWPEAGEEMDVPDVVGADLCASGAAEPVAQKAKSEKRPAGKSETREK